jgi:hypothetical protein
VVGQRALPSTHGTNRDAPSPNGRVVSTFQVIRCPYFMKWKNNVGTELSSTILDVLRERGFVFQFIEQTEHNSKLIKGMRILVYRNDSYRLAVCVGDKGDSFSIGITELSTNREQSMGFHVPSNKDLKSSVEETIDSSLDILPILRGEKSPSNVFDWGDYK